MSDELTNIENIQTRIFTFRGLQVMIDRDLAETYGVEVKRLNEQVKRNIERFTVEFRFQLNNSEKNELVAKCDRLENLTKLPLTKCKSFYNRIQKVLNRILQINKKTGL